MTHKFTGQEYDASTDLMYYGLVIKDAEIARFTTADTVLPGNGVNPQGLNRYAYTLNNPIKYIDPSGHTPESPDETTAKNISEGDARVKKSQRGTIAALKANVGILLKDLLVDSLGAPNIPKLISDTQNLLVSVGTALDSGTLTDSWPQ